MNQQLVIEFRIVPAMKILDVELPLYTSEPVRSDTLTVFSAFQVSSQGAHIEHEQEVVE